MLKQFKVLSGLVCCLLITAVVAITIPSEYFIPVRSYQTEILTKSGAENGLSVAYYLDVPVVPDADASPRFAFDILRWHNHTINLHLRNVRSRWLTFMDQEHKLPAIHYPSEEVTVIRG